MTTNETFVENNSFYSIKQIRLNSKEFSSVHYHRHKKETFYVLNGELELHFSKNTDKDVWDLNLVDHKILKSNESLTIDPFMLHRVCNNSHIPCDFLEISNHHNNDDHLFATPQDMEQI